MLKTKERVIYNNLFNFNIYNYIKSLFTERDFFTSSVRLVVRTLGFHPKNRSSILLRSTMEKITYRKIIEDAKKKLDTQDNLVQDWYNIEELAQEFGIYNSISQETERIKEVYVNVHFCTDSWVGETVVFLDGEAIAVTSQSGRKSDKFYYFISDETRDKAYDYVKSLLIVELSSAFIDIDAEIDEYYSVDYVNEIIHDHGFYYNPSLEKYEKVKIGQKEITGDQLTDYISKRLYVTFLDRKSTMIVDVQDIKFKYNQSLKE